MGKSSILSPYNLILAMVAMVAMDASFRILHQPEADEKNKPKGVLQMTPWHALIVHDP